MQMKGGGATDLRWCDRQRDVMEHLHAGNSMLEEIRNAAPPWPTKGKMKADCVSGTIGIF